MSFDTSYQNTGLSEGQGRPLATPKSVTKHKAPIGGCRSTPLFFTPPKHKKRELFSSLFSPKFLLFRGRILAFSERVYDCRYTCRKIACCCLRLHTQHSFFILNNCLSVGFLAMNKHLFSGIYLYYIRYPMTVSPKGL